MENEMNRLNEIVNNKAKDKLNNYIETMRFCDIDQMNTHIILPNNFGYVSTDQETKGKKMVRADEFISWIKEAVYRKCISNYQENERREFLNNLQQIRDYLKEPIQ